MCAEKDPFICHRFFFISWSLSQLGFRVIYIISKKNTLRNPTLEIPLKEKYTRKSLLDLHSSSCDKTTWYESHAIKIYNKKNTK
uniref:Uncharacterized protein n=1 Tax=Promethearchaeum syntrophicum TaxID=2594042 RepID=A0A5B9D8H4_9ARCH|nr:hypothetical protein DSAG12_01011 [Candidatus Prometheoarchaeum syntrophicum]